MEEQKHVLVSHMLPYIAPCRGIIPHHGGLTLQSGLPILDLLIK